MINIKNNKIIYDKSLLEGYHTYLEDGLRRKKKIIYILEKLLEKYKIKDTILFFNYSDGYNWKNMLPVFNFALPIGKQGLIFLNFDIFDFGLPIGKKDTLSNFDEIKNKIQKHHIKKIENDIFFRGAYTSEYRSKIREKFNILKIL